MEPKSQNICKTAIIKLLAQLRINIVSSYFFIFYSLLFIIISAPLCRAQNSITVNQIELPKPFDHAEIKYVMADNDGFIWFTTNQGMWRFDGTDVQPVDIHNPVLPQNTVPIAIYHYRNFLLFATVSISGSTYRLLYYDIEKKLLRQSILPGRPIDYIIDKTGALKFMTTDGSLFYFTTDKGLEKKIAFYTYTGWIKGSGIQNYAIDPNGNIYIFTQDRVGLVRKNDIIWSDVTDTVKKLTYVIRAYATSKYIVAIHNTGLAVYNKNLKNVFAQATAINYNLSAPSKDGMLPVYQDIKAKIRNFCIIPGSNKRLLSSDKGIFEITPSETVPDEVNRQQQVVDFFNTKSIRSIYRAANNKLYIGTYNGLFMYDGTSFKEINNLVAYTIEPIDSNRLLIGMEGGEGFLLLDTRTDAWQKNPHTGDPIGTTKILKYGNNLISGAYDYIYYLTPLPNGDYNVAPWLNDKRLGIVKDLKFISGELWIAAEGGVFKVSKAGWEQKVYPLGRSLRCYALQSDNNGIWVGTGGEGLIKIDTNGKKINEIHFNDGLAGEYVYSLLSLNKILVCGTGGGISIFDQNADMQALSIPDLAPTDGSQFQEFNHSAIYNDVTRHKIILGGTQGLAFIDADYLKSATGTPTDRVRLSYVKRGYSTTQPTDVDIFALRSANIVVLPGNIYTGLKFSGPPRQKYVLFRIKELDDKWHQGKLADEVSLFAIPPGKYTLEARFPSVNDPKYWLHENLIVVPRYYETFVFKVFIVLIILFIIYLAWRYNANKIRKEQQLRTTIASDLHDEIGSTLTRISLNSELFSYKEVDRSVMEKISDDSKKALSSISDIIWSVDSRNDNNEDLVLRMKDHAHKMLEDTAELHYSVSGIASTANLPQTLRQNVYLIYKEAINNIIRHNQEPTVWIKLENGRGGFTMEIKNTIQRKKGNGYKGQGVKNMQMRAARINAIIQIADNDDIFSVILKMKEWK